MVSFSYLFSRFVLLCPWLTFLELQFFLIRSFRRESTCPVRSQLDVMWKCCVGSSSWFSLVWSGLSLVTHDVFRVVCVVASLLDFACLVSARRPWRVWFDFVLPLMGLLLLLSSCLGLDVFCFALLFCLFFCVSPCSVALLRLGLSHARGSVFFVYVV